MELNPTISGDRLAKYQAFKAWFKHNGGLFSEDDIEFPALFQPGNYIGMRMKRDVKVNKTMIAVPQHLIISLDKARHSSIKSILNKYDLFTDEEDSDSEFNVLAMYLIYEKMQEQKSFYYPYLNCLEPAETILNWTSKEIAECQDPHVISYSEQLRAEYTPLFDKFLKITLTHSQHFPNRLTFELFLECYQIVMTRCFGWGLPQTMLVPFADFMNHGYEGVYHFMCNSDIENSAKKPSEYVVKKGQLDLTLLGITAQEHKKYEPDARARLIKKYFPELSETEIRINQHKYLDKIHKENLLSNFDTLPTLDSEDSEDNDSEDDEESIFSQPNYQQLAKKEKPYDQLQREEKFERPKPPICREFEEETEWDWWSYDQSKTYFIVSTGRPHIKGEQLYNSYGHRSNRFLLMWYGFTLDQNKYNSVPFRLWMWKGENLRTRKQLFYRHISDEEWEHGIIMNDEVLPAEMLTKQFRLKESGLNEELIVYLRLQTISNNPKYLQTYTKEKDSLKINYPSRIDFEIEVLKTLMGLVQDLAKVYKADTYEKDDQLLKSGNIKDPRLLFSVQLRHSNKRILRIHIVLIQLAIEILDDIHNKTPYLEAVSKKRQVMDSSLDTSNMGEVFYIRKLAPYLRTVREAV